MNRFLFTFAILAFLLPSFPAVAQEQADPARTPFSYVRQDDVGSEINVTMSQVALIDQFQPICDAACEAQVQEAMDTMPKYLQDIYADMPFQQRMNAKTLLEQDIQESTELSVLQGQILEPDQMSRFNQLWTQQSGLGGLMSGSTSRNLGITEGQKSRISQVQSIGFQAMDACAANPSLTPSQRNTQINQIQNTMIDNSINILNIGQVNIYVNLCGKKFAPPTGEDPTGEENPTGEETPTDDEPPTTEGSGDDLVSGDAPSDAQDDSNTRTRPDRTSSADESPKRSGVRSFGNSKNKSPRVRSFGTGSDSAGNSSSSSASRPSSTRSANSTRSSGTRSFDSSRTQSSGNNSSSGQATSKDSTKE